MSEQKTIIIKKYANRRLYNTDTSSYITLQDLAVLVKNDSDFQVIDAKTGEDLTRSVLAQIIFEEENKGETLLPQNFLKELIKYYDDSLKALVPGYLDYALKAFGSEQDHYREYMEKAFSATSSFGSILEKQTRANMELFEKSFNLLGDFKPHVMGADFFTNAMNPVMGKKPEQATSGKSVSQPMPTQPAPIDERPSSAPQPHDDSLDEVTALKEEIEALQKAINILAKKAQ